MFCFVLDDQQAISQTNVIPFDGCADMIFVLYASNTEISVTSKNKNKNLFFVVSCF